MTSTAASSEQPRNPPLEGVRVLAVEQYGAGPWATLQLADMGAEVIKIESPTDEGDVGRYIPPYRESDTSLFFETFNRNKKSVALDIKHADGRRAFEALVASSHIVFSNLRGDLPRSLGLMYDQLGLINPRVVCCSLSGYGTTGPRAAEGGYDYMMQGITGWMSLTGDPDGPPTKSGPSLVDISAGYVAAVAMLAALRDAEKTGVGGDCDISLFETALAELIYIATWVATKGYEPSRTRDSAHPSIVPFQNFRTLDGWIVVACPKDKFWRGLCSALGMEQLAEDDRFSGLEKRFENRDELLQILRDVFVGKTTHAWLELLETAEVPSAPVNKVKDVLVDPQAVARNAVVEIDHPLFGPMRQIASPLRIFDAMRSYVRAPSLGQHTEQVLQDLGGLTPAEVDALVLAGAATLRKGEHQEEDKAQRQRRC